MDVRNLVFVDEAGVNLGLSRLYGRAIGGERVTDSTPRNTGQHISVLGALSIEGLIAMMRLTGSVDTPCCYFWTKYLPKKTAVFLAYVTKILVPQLWTGAVVVMDNLKVHYAARVQAEIETVGAKVMFLPPYSPDLSPIELCWSTLKQFWRSRAARTIEALDARHHRCHGLHYRRQCHRLV